LSLSSTAVVIKQLTEQNELHSHPGRLSFSILLFQDLAAVLFLILIPSLAGPVDTSLTPSLMALGKGVGIFIVLAFIGRWLLRPLFHEVAKAHSTELFMMATLLVVLGAAGVTHYLNLSMSLGAFLAGLMLGETEFRHQIEIDIRPFRDVLLGLFFITVGSWLKLSDLPGHWHWVLVVLLALTLGKATLITALTLISERVSLNKAIRTGLILAQGGEFSFVVLTEAMGHKLLDPEQNQVVVAAVVLSIFLSPLIIRYNKKIASLFNRKVPGHDLEIESEATAAALLEHTAELKEHVIICGFGRVGQILARVLEQEHIPSVALDLDPSRISKATLAGELSFYGDARRPETLAAAGLARARMLVISFDDEEAALEVLKHVRALRLDLPIFVRTQDDSNLAAFQEAGATEVVPEILEASLMLAAHLLLTLGVPASKVLLKVREAHADRYRMFKGYFQGTDDTNTLETEENERRGLHTITITEGATAAGKSYDELFGTDTPSPIKMITRESMRITDPEGSIALQPGDVLVVYASPEEFYLFEEKILRGL